MKVELSYKVKKGPDAKKHHKVLSFIFFPIFSYERKNSFFNFVVYTIYQTKTAKNKNIPT